MRRGVRVLALLVTLLAAACSQDMFDGESDLVLLNDSSCEIVVWVDGREAFVVEAGAERVLDGIGPGRHLLEAVDTRGRVVERRTVELAQGEDYYWTLSSC